MTNVEAAIQSLFPEGEPARVTNVKFASGTKSHVTAEELAGQILSANEQIASGKAKPIVDIDGDL